MKECADCKKEKPYSEFHKRSTGSKDGHFSKCKLCRKEEAAIRYTRDKDRISKSAKKWSEKNPELRKLADKKWKQKNKEKCCEYTKRWRERNPEKHNEIVSKRSKKKLVEATLRWQKNNPEKAAHLAAMRRANIKKAIPKWANIDLIREMYNNRPKGYHVDHVIPLSGKTVCGLHCEDNLQYLPAIENIAKNNQLIEGHCHG